MTGQHGGTEERPREEPTQETWTDAELLAPRPKGPKHTERDPDRERDAVDTGEQATKKAPDQWRQRHVQGALSGRLRTEQRRRPETVDQQPPHGSDV